MRFTVIGDHNDNKFIAKVNETQYINLDYDLDEMVTFLDDLIECHRLLCIKRNEQKDLDIVLANIPEHQLDTIQSTLNQYNYEWLKVVQ